jgi:hypothetical protein
LILTLGNFQSDSRNKSAGRAIKVCAARPVR